MSRCQRSECPREGTVLWPNGYRFCDECTEERNQLASALCQFSFEEWPEKLRTLAVTDSEGRTHRTAPIDE